MQVPFERIVREHSLSVLRVCRALLDEHRAQDAWQETFLAALTSIDRLPEDANVQAWLVRIAHHKAIDVIRADGRYETAEPDVLQAATTGQPERRVDDQELWQVVKLLPDKQRQVVAYRYIGGLSYADIAQIVGGTPEAARRAASDGLRSLRQGKLRSELLGEEL